MYPVLKPPVLWCSHELFCNTFLASLVGNSLKKTRKCLLLLFHLTLLWIWKYICGKWKWGLAVGSLAFNIKELLHFTLSRLSACIFISYFNFVFVIYKMSRELVLCIVVRKTSKSDVIYNIMPRGSHSHIFTDRPFSLNAWIFVS
jgi:hypothetical protein